MIRRADDLLTRLRAVHATIRDAILRACDGDPGGVETWSAVVGSEGGDTVFAIDRVSEAVVLREFDAIAREWPLLLVAEGLGETGRRVLPDGATPEIVVIADPIDGTRGLMYQKRPGWILTGVAPARERGARLSDIELAVQTEIPLQKQHLSDSIWTIGPTMAAERWNRLTGFASPLTLQPSAAKTILQGFGGIARFFPGVRGELAALDDAVVQRIAGRMPPGLALAFEDQYISTAGQLYELMAGHDRWCADLRPLAWARLGQRGLCVHPYDLCTQAIARQAGVIVTDAYGHDLDGPLDVHTDLAWIGYANGHIRDEVEPVLQDLLRSSGWLR
jgi:hypothetical protein